MANEFQYKINGVIYNAKLVGCQPGLGNSFEHNEIYKLYWNSGYIINPIEDESLEIPALSQTFFHINMHYLLWNGIGIVNPYEDESLDIPPLSNDFNHPNNYILKYNADFVNPYESESTVVPGLGNLFEEYDPEEDDLYEDFEDYNMETNFENKVIASIDYEIE